MVSSLLFSSIALTTLTDLTSGLHKSQFYGCLKFSKDNFIIPRVTSRECRSNYMQKGFQFCTNYTTVSGDQNKTKLNLVKHLTFKKEFLPGMHICRVFTAMDSPQWGKKYVPGVDKSGRGVPSGCASYKRVPVPQADSGWLRGVKARFSTTLRSFLADDREL